MSEQDPKQSGMMLKRLRQQHRETVERTQALLKEQQAIRRQICKVIRDDGKTVPEVAEESGLPANEVLWHITAMKKYDLVVEVGQCGEYYRYTMAEEAES